MPDLQVTSRSVNTVVDFTVSAPYSGNGSAVDYSDASISALLYNTSAAQAAGERDVLYRVDSGQWFTLPAGSKQSVAIDLSTQTLTMKRAQFASVASVSMTVEGVPGGLYAGGKSLGGSASPSVGPVDHLQSSDGAGGFKDAGTAAAVVAANQSAPNGFSMTVPVPDLTGSGDPELAGVGAGNLSNGIYSYKLTLLTPSGETLPSVATNPVTVVDHTADGQVNLPIPFFPQEGTFPLSWNVYRTTAGGSTFKLVANTDFYTTPFTDNVADADLGVDAPTVSTAIESGYTISGDGVLTPPYAPVFNGTLLKLGTGGQLQVIITPETPPGGSPPPFNLSGAFAGQGSGQAGGVVNIYGGLSDTGQKGGDVVIAPGGFNTGNQAGVVRLFATTSATPMASWGQMVFELTNDTTLTIKVAGSDNVVRSVALTLTP